MPKKAAKPKAAKPKAAKPKAAAEPEFAEGDLRSLKVLRKFREILAEGQAQSEALVHRSFADPKRQLLLGD